jgi:hypothetical protein
MIENYAPARLVPANADRKLHLLLRRPATAGFIPAER